MGFSPRIVCVAPVVANGEGSEIVMGRGSVVSAEAGEITGSVSARRSGVWGNTGSFVFEACRSLPIVGASAIGDRYLSRPTLPARPPGKMKS